MRDMFPEHFPPEADSTEKLWKEAVIVFDTNVLIDIHAWPEERAKWFLDQCEQQLGDRLWLPNQVAREFTRNRTVRLKHRQKVISDAIDALRKQYEGIEGKITGGLETVRVDFDKDSFPDIKTQIDTWLQPKINLLEKERNHLRLREELKNDAVFERLEVIYGSRIGPPFGLAKERELYAEGARRYGGLTPPGFGDVGDKKEDYRLYGDLFIWEQILDHAQAAKGIIFVTNESNKRDWFIDDKQRRPHPELLREFRIRAQGKGFGLYGFKDFLFLAEKYHLIVGETEYAKAVREAERDEEERRKRYEEEQEELERLRRQVRSQSSFDPESGRVSFASLMPSYFIDSAPTISSTIQTPLRQTPFRAFWSGNETILPGAGSSTDLRVFGDRKNFPIFITGDLKGPWERLGATMPNSGSLIGKEEQIKSKKSEEQLVSEQERAQKSPPSNEATIPEAESPGKDKSSE